MIMLTQPEELVNSVAVIASCSPQTPTPFITQAQRPATGSKRKSLSARGGEAEDEHLVKRPAGTSSGFEEEEDCSPEEGAEFAADCSPSDLKSACKAAPDSSAEQQQNSGTIFSPGYAKGSGCGQHAASAETAVGNDGVCSDENVRPKQQLHHYAHHPPPPEVPEAAESDYDEDEDDDDCLGFDPLAFIRSLPSLEEVVPRFRKALLPKQTRQCKQKTLVLDLDETLVHSSLDMVVAPDFSFPVQFNNQEHTIHVRQRPHLHEFMSRVSELFEIVVFTASQKIYAEKLLNIIDPKHKYIKHRIYRDSCVIVDGNYLKDLSVLGRDLANTLIVDNSPQAFGFQIDNGVPIESWYEDPADDELAKLLPFLEGLVDVEDVRPHIAQKFRLRELIEGSV